MPTDSVDKSAFRRLALGAFPLLLGVSFVLPGIWAAAHWKKTQLPGVVMLEAASSVERPQWGDAFTVRVAGTPDAWRRGLMHITHLAPPTRCGDCGNDARSLPREAIQGMLFDFHGPMRVCMWMKHTAIPLTALFLGADGRVLSRADMRPETLDMHCSPGPVRYVLEVRHGYLRKAVIFRIFQKINGA